MVPIRRYARDWCTYLAVGGLGLIIGRLIGGGPNNDGVPNGCDKKPNETKTAREYSDHLYKKIITFYAPNEGWHPDEKRHRSKERRYWWCSIALSVLTLFGAVAATYYAGKAYVQTKRQADAAEAANRPWLDIEPIITPLKMGAPFQVEMTWVNAGHTPAWNVYTFAMIETVKRGDPDPAELTSIPGGTLNAKAYGILIPGVTSHSFVEFTLATGQTALSWTPNQDAMTQLQNGLVTIWLLGIATYSDPAGNPHYIHERGVFDPETDGFSWRSGEAN